VGSKDNNNMGEYAKRFTLDALLPFNHDYAAAEVEFLACPSGNIKLQKLLEKKLSVAKSAALVQICSCVRILFCTLTEVHKLVRTDVMRDEFVGRVTTVIVDEAGALPEWQAALIAQLPAVQRVIFVGDIKQLPPFSLIKEDKAPRGFLERVQNQFARCKMPVPMLTRQFRMHPDIAQLVSDAFYDGHLKSDATSTLARSPQFLPGGLYLAGLYWLVYDRDKPTHEFVEKPVGSGMYALRAVSSKSAEAGAASGEQCFEEQIYNSWTNATEIHHILEGLELFVTSGIFAAGKSVAVISFYKQQNELLKLAVEASRHSAALLSAVNSAALRLQTVDSSQGDEADIVILSCVRSNPNGDVGFISGLNGTKRTCVALSRPREALVIVGDPATVAKQSGKLAFNRLWPNGEPATHMKLLNSFGVLAAAVGARISKAAAAEQIFETFGATTAASEAAGNDSDNEEDEDLDGDFM
jgi:hypothetical protein